MEGVGRQRRGVPAFPSRFRTFNISIPFLRPHHILYPNIQEAFLNQWPISFVLCGNALWALFLSRLADSEWLAAQLSTQISLAFVTIAPFAHLELVDIVRALHASQAADPAGALPCLQQAMLMTEGRA